MGDKHHAAFCAVRPPGHHAERHAAMGFCFFNNVAVGAAHALAELGMRAHRHHRLRRPPRQRHRGHLRRRRAGAVLLQLPAPVLPRQRRRLQGAERRQHPAAGAHRRRRLPRRGGGALAAAARRLRAAAGHDLRRLRRHIEDDMAHFNLREAGLRLDHQGAARPRRSPRRGRIVSCLEGGYSLSALGRSVAVHLDELIGHGGRRRAASNRAARRDHGCWSAAGP
jgi:hypothetical protein